MNEPFSLTQSTARFGLPFLFAAQAQKEFFINEAYVLLDSLLHPVVEGRSDTPAATPVEGECWLVGGTPTDDWGEHAEQVACFHSGSWLFIRPAEGMRVFDRSSNGDLRFFQNQWISPQLIQAPQNGETIDTEARQAIADLIQALVAQGLLSGDPSS